MKGGSHSGLVMLFTLLIFLSICYLYRPTGCISREEPSRFVRDEVEQKAANPGQHLSPLLQACLRKRSELATLGQAPVVVVPGAGCGAGAALQSCVGSVHTSSRTKSHCAAEIAHSAPVAHQGACQLGPDL